VVCDRKVLLPYRKVLEEGKMKVSYDPRTDTLSAIFMEDVQVTESDEEKPGVILDYDQEGHLVSLEILEASQRIMQTRKIEFETIEHSTAMEVQ